MAVVLVLEDNADLREMYEEILAIGGHSVLLSETASDARAVLASERPSVMLLDLGIEGGAEGLVAEMRANPDLAGIAVILASGARDLEEWAVALSADGFLQKPFTHEQLIEAVRKVTSHTGA